MSLAVYNKKRNFKLTDEPAGKKMIAGRMRFVVQRHQASHLHYDFRLELGGVLKSWAVPKGPSMNPAQKRLAVMVEDHPVSYIDFKGTIPKGNYGAGTVEIWDNGKFAPVNSEHKKITDKQALQQLKKGELKFSLSGKKLKGEFVLVRLKNDEKNWLLIKHKDSAAVSTMYDAENSDKGKTRSVASIRHGRAKKLKNFIKPMLASPSSIPFNDTNWIFEIKWDGYRGITEINDNSVKFYSRNGIDFSERFPVIYTALQKIKHNCILDGEIVLLNNKNLPDFQRLQNYENNLDLPLIYYVFDLLQLDGKNMEQLSLIDRKSILKKLLKKNKIIHYCDHVETDGVEFLKQVKEKGLEGIIAKHKEGEYIRGQRSKQWLKLKNIQSTEVVIAGYTAPKGQRNHFGSLVLANKKGNDWIYRGHAGTGFSGKTLEALKKIMKPLETDQSPFKEKVPVNGEVTWLQPKLVADIAYTEMTTDKVFRHPVFLRLRDDKKMKNLHEEIIKETTPIQNNETIKVGRHSVNLTNRQKIFWPEEGYTKGDVMDYYEKIYRTILPHLKNRPLSLKRNPNGIRDEGFYHKDAGEKAPEYVKVFKTESESSNKVIDYIVCNNKATLLYLANLGCIEMNPWNSTIQQPGNPTWMVIDIDPAEKNTFQQVVDTALATKEILDKAGVKSYCKTSGASGLHVYVPMKNKYDFTTVKDFAHIIASMVTELLPGYTTLERSLKKRGNNIYVDYLQNRSGQTLASAYSIRPVPGATVSAPLEWKEVNKSLTPSDFTIVNIFDRIKKKGDLFSAVLTGTTNIEKALARL
ncbi:MAG: DNA ligase D [Chitinophagaceae bacterium]